MNGSARSLMQAAGRAGVILATEPGDRSFLARYLALRDVALMPLQDAGATSLAARIKNRIRMPVLAPVDRLRERLLAEMRRALLVEAEASPRPAGLPGLVYVAPFDVLSRNGGAARVLGLARAFGACYDVSIISIVGPNRVPEIIPVAPGVRIVAIPQTPEFLAAVEADRAVYRGAAVSLGLDRHARHLPLLDYWYRRLAEDAAVSVINQPYLGGLWRRHPGTARKLYDVPEVNSFFTVRMAGPGADEDAVKKEQYRLEADVIGMADAIGMCSARDVDALADAFGEPVRAKVKLVANGIHVDEQPFFPPGRARVLASACAWRAPLAIFLGSPAYPPNLEAVRFIAETLAPACPEAVFAIIGMQESETRLSSIPPNLAACGRVSDADKTALLALADVALSPIHSYDSGSSLKIADYLAHGKPVLATDHGWRGYEALGEVATPVPDAAFADALRRLWSRLASDASACDDAARRARANLAAHYDWSVIARSYGM